MRFPVVLHTDDGLRYGVTVPDLPGCFSAGESFDDALDSVIEAIELHLEGIAAETGTIPLPHPIAAHRANPDYADGVWAAVEVDVSRFEETPEKIDIILPRRLLTQIDEYARSHGTTRSSFIADAARHAMAGQR